MEGRYFLNILELVLPFGIMIGMMYFLLIRPQKKQQEKVQSMLDSLAVGANVVTIGGLHGVIDEIDTEEGTVVLDCEGIYLTFERRSIARVISEGTALVSPTDDIEESNSDETEI